MKPIQNPILKSPLNELLVTPPDLRAKHYRKHDLINSTVSKVAYVAAAAIALATAFVIGSAALGLMAFPSPFIYPALLAAFVIALKTAPHFQAKSSQFHKKYEVENEIAKEYNRLTKAVKTKEDLRKELAKVDLPEFNCWNPELPVSNFVKKHLAKKPDYLDEGQWLFKLLPLIARHNHFNQSFKDIEQTLQEIEKPPSDGSLEEQASFIQKGLNSSLQQIPLQLEKKCIERILQNPFCKESSLEDFGKLEITPISNEKALDFVTILKTAKENSLKAKSLEDIEQSGEAFQTTQNACDKIFTDFFEKNKPGVFTSKTGKIYNLFTQEKQIDEIFQDETSVFLKPAPLSRISEEDSFYADSETSDYADSETSEENFDRW